MNPASPAPMATFLCPDKALEALLQTFLDPVLRNLPPYGCPKASEGIVSKQMEVIGWLYNRYLCCDFPNLINLDWEELCTRASKERSKLLRFITTAKEGIPCSLTLTEQRVKHACETAKVVVNIHNNVQNFPVTKICVCLLNSTLNKCVTASDASTMGVWTFIEKETCVQYKEGDKITDSEEDFVFKAIQEYTGIRTNALKIGDSFLVVDDMNQSGCSTKLYIVLCNGTFELSPTIKLETIVWLPLSVTLSMVDGPLVELTDDSAVRSTSAVHYFRLRPFCPFIKNWLTSHQEREQKIGYSRMNADEKLGSCKPEGFEQAVTLPCKPIAVMVSEFEMKQDTCNGKLTAKKEDTKSSSTCLHSQNQRLPMDSLQNEMKSSVDEDNLTLHQQATPTQNVNLNDTIMPPDAFMCRHPQPTSMLPDDMTSHNDACIHAEIAAMAVTPAGNIEEYQIHKNTDDLPIDCAPLRNEVSKCAPETEKVKKRSSPLKFGVHKDSKCDCNQEHDGKLKQVKLENSDVSLHVHSPKTSMREIKRFEDHCMDKETSAFSLNKALHNVWKKRKAMCKELKILHSQVDALHEKIARCDSNLATLIGGGRSGLHLAIQICKVELDKQMSSSDDCLDQEGHEEAPLSTEVISNEEQKNSKKRPLHMLKNSTEELQEVCIRNNWLPPSYGVLKSTDHQGDVKYTGKVKIKNEVFELTETGELSDTAKAAKLSAAGYMLSTLHLVRARNGTF